MKANPFPDDSVPEWVSKSRIKSCSGSCLIHCKMRFPENADVFLYRLRDACLCTDEFGAFTMSIKADDLFNFIHSDKFICHISLYL